MNGQVAPVPTAEDVKDLVVGSGTVVTEDQIAAAIDARAPEVKSVMRGGAPRIVR